MFRSLYQAWLCPRRRLHRALHAGRPGRQRRSNSAPGAETCAADGVALAVFPELSVSGYAIDDLLLSDALQDATEQALLTLIARSADLLPVLVVGAPLRHGARLYNCAVAIHRGRLLGVVPKVHLPNYREFYEKRHFASGDGVARRRPSPSARTMPRSGPTCCSPPRTCRA